MALRLSVDTTFLIDLQRERSAARDDGAAHRFLRRSPEAELFLSTVALGEFAEGFDRAEHPIVAAAPDGHTLVPVHDRTAFMYARAVRGLARRGEPIGSNDRTIRWPRLRPG